MWEWAFEDSRHSPLLNFPPSEIAGFTDAATGERLDFSQVKEHATHLCTALVEKYGLKATDTVSLFSQNTIWYPVAMFATLRAGSLNTQPSFLIHMSGVQISNRVYIHTHAKYIVTNID